MPHRRRALTEWIDQLDPKDPKVMIVLSNMVLSMAAVYRNTDTSVDAILVAQAVRLGHLRGKLVRTTQIAKKTHIHVRNVRRHLEKLEATNVVEHGPDGTWRLGQNGLNDEAINRYDCILRALRTAEIALVKLT